MQFRSRTIVAATCLLILLAIDQASAATINYTQDRRYTDVAGSSTNGFIYTYPTAPFADMNTSLQTSSLGTTGFTAAGYGSAYSNYSWSASESVFDITFSVANGTTMQLSGQLSGVSINYGSGNASISLFRGDNKLDANLLYSNSVAAWDYNPQSAAINFTSVLNAGEYRLVAIANPYFQIANSSFNLNASFTPVPVPAAVWLLGSGLLGLTGFVRRRTAAG